MVTKNEVRFTVPGEPVGKGRPRLSSRNGFAHAYTPAGTRKYEAAVRKLAGEEMERQGLAVTELPVYVSIAARYAIPKRHLASDGSLRSHKAGTKLADELSAMLNGDIMPGKPDLDNVVKAVLDALNGTVFTDDSQVVSLVAGKDWQNAEEGYGPGVDVAVWWYADA